jgi:hypothetical protein
MVLALRFAFRLPPGAVFRCRGAPAAADRFSVNRAGGCPAILLLPAPFVAVHVDADLDVAAPLPLFSATVYAEAISGSLSPRLPPPYQLTESPGGSWPVFVRMSEICLSMNAASFFS